MSLFSIFSRRKPSSKPDAETLAPPRPVAMPAAAPRLPALKREEVIDRQSRLYGYRFTMPNDADDGTLFSALAAENIQLFAANRLAVLPLSLAAAASHSHAPFAAEHTVFVLDAGELHGQAGVELLQSLRVGGARSGMRGLPSETHHEALLGACDILFLDLGAVDLRHFHAVLESLKRKHPRLKVTVEAVDTWEERRMCLEWGADYCLGDFLRQPDRQDQNDSLDQSRLTAIKLLNLLRSDAELPELAEVAKQDPGITFQLLKWANSPVNGQAAPVTSMGQAITVLGRNALYRWLAVAIFKLGKQRDRDIALLELALRRARFLETVNLALSSGERDELFLVGLFSLFDLMFGMPMEKLLTYMNVSDHAHKVLLRSEGKYAPYLRLALVMERGDSARIAALAATIGVDPADIADVQARAFAWTQESLQQQAAS